MGRREQGTLNSVINMLRQVKPVVVYLAPQKAFQNVRSADDLADLLNKCDRATVQRFERELGIEHVLYRALIPIEVQTRCLSCCIRGYLQ
jgi:hypothetical protein